LRPIHHCCLTFIFNFLLWCLVPPIRSNMTNHKKLGPTSVVFV
jgi:hypothetical protein